MSRLQLIALVPFALTMSAHGAFAQQPEPAVGDGTVAETAASPHDEVDLGRDRDQRMTVPVSIGSQGPFPFIVDTGSERTVISNELAATLGLNPSGTAEVHSVSGVNRVDTVSVAALSVSKTGARDLTAPLLKERNLGAPGILGIDSLQKHRILLDFREDKMTVFPADRKSRPKFDDDDETIVISARNRLGRLILADAKVNNRRVAVVIDTGAEHSIGNAMLRDKVLKRNSGTFVVPTKIYSVTGEVVPAEVTLVKSMQLGSLSLTQMPIAFADLTIFRQLGLDRKPAMLLGMNTMRAFRKISVDFANRQVTFVVPGESSLDAGTRLAMAGN